MRAPNRIDIARRALGQALAHPYTWAPFVPIAGAYAFIGAPWWVCLPTALAVGSGVGTAWARRWASMMERVRTEAMADYRRQENEELNQRIVVLAHSAGKEGQFLIALREAVGIKRNIEDRLFGDGVLSEHEEEVDRMIANLVRTMIEEAERLPPTLGKEFQEAMGRFEKAAQTLRQAHKEIDVILDPLPEEMRTPAAENDALSRASERLGERIEQARGVRRFWNSACIHPRRQTLNRIMRLTPRLNRCLKAESIYLFKYGRKGCPAPRIHLKLDCVGKTYRNGAQVLEGIDLSIEEGSFVSIIGPSGCGKSTLLKLISGLSSISAGKIVIEGMTPANARETMSFIFQDATLLPWRTVTRNVSLGLELEGMPAARRQAKVRDLLVVVGLDGVAECYPRQLSGGMKMRVSIARALATTPRLLLMDEPFGALDEITRDRLNEELLRLRDRDHWTALFVTHSVAEAVFLSNRILVLSANPGRGGA